MRCPWIVVAFLIQYFCNTESERKQAKYKLSLESFVECRSPHPPYAKPRTFKSFVTILRNKTGNIMSGEHNVLTEIPFSNLTIDHYKVESSGKKQLVLHFEKLNCRSYVAKLFLILSGIRYSKDCLLIKGKYPIRDFDIDKVSDAFPNRHTEGSFYHRAQMGHKRFTDLCFEMTTTNKMLG